MRFSPSTTGRAVHVAFCVAATWLACTPGHAQVAPYAERYAASHDVREFIDGRDASPADGSYFYAYLARWECGDDGDIAQRVAPSALADPNARRVAATRRQLERCAHVPRAITGIAAQASDVNEGRHAGDRLFSVFAGEGGAAWFRKSDSAEFRNALTMYSEANDPNIVWVIGQQLGHVAGYRVALDGRRLTEAEGRSMSMAFLLASCTRIVDCGPSHRWMRSLCVQDGDGACADADLETRWRRRSVGDPPGWTDWDRIQRYVDRIAQASRARDWSAFALVDPETK